MIRNSKSVKQRLTILVTTLSVATTSFAAELDYGPVTLSATAGTCSQPNTAVGEYLGLINQVRQQQPELAEALRLFPKGADIHNHLSGTIMPGNYIAMGAADSSCYGPDSNAANMYTLATATTSGTCGSGFKPLISADQTDQAKIMQSLSMYQFTYPNIQQGHDQFFATFGRFGAVSGVPCNTAPMLAALLRQANADSVSYVETMLSFQSQAVNTLAKLLRQKFPDNSTYQNSANYPALYNYLVGAGLTDAVAGAQNDITMYATRTSALLRCGRDGSDPACGVSYSFLAAVNRNSAQKDGSPDLAKIFTQTAFSMLLSATDSRVAGVNLLSGEDAVVSMKSFDTQMKFFGYFHQLFPGVNIALHAGELIPCFVGNDKPALKNHLTGSIRAGAKRIGHGVSFAYLQDSDKTEVAGLLKQNDALVEIMFTSNAQILGVAGDAHPFRQYDAYQVPMAFSTDDEGVSYANYTDEWIYGVKKYNLTGDYLEYLGRNSLQYSFIPGSALWSDVRAGKVVTQCAGVPLGTSAPPEPCGSYLAANAKANAQWDYETRLVNYWRNYGKQYGKYLRKK